MTRAMQRGTHGNHWKMMPKEWMSWINHLDLGRVMFFWVLEQGIVL
jgi:hypothetical protein